MWQTGNRIVRSPTLGREAKPDIFCEWNTKCSIFPEIPSKRVHSKRIPKFSKTLPGIFTFPFNFGPEIAEFLVEWKAPPDCHRLAQVRYSSQTCELNRRHVITIYVLSIYQIHLYTFLFEVQFAYQRRTSITILGMLLKV